MTDLAIDSPFIGQDSFVSSPIDFSSPGSSVFSPDIRNLPSPSPTPSVVIKQEGESTEPQRKDEKPVKKRKSWGQQLPTPTTNLPPRKRAKTAEEKEQRRVERVLRNRAAAQKSREVKKQQLEKIELERDDLKKENTELKEKNEYLQSLLRQNGIAFDDLQTIPPTFDFTRTPQSPDSSSLLSFNDDQFTESSELFDTLNPSLLNFDDEPTPLKMQQPAELLSEDQPCHQGMLKNIIDHIIKRMKDQIKVQRCSIPAVGRMTILP